MCWPKVRYFSSFRNCILNFNIRYNKSNVQNEAFLNFSPKIVKHLPYISFVPVSEFSLENVKIKF